MQKIFDEVNSLDKRCYEKFFLTEDILMEHAASSMCKYIEDNFPHVYTAGLVKTHLGALSVLYAWIFSNFEHLHGQDHDESLKIKERILRS